jgi:hypothetical protein
MKEGRKMEEGKEEKRREGKGREGKERTTALLNFLPHSIVPKIQCVGIGKEREGKGRGGKERQRRDIQSKIFSK